MSEMKIITPIDALVSLVKSSLTANSAQTFGHLVLYTTFGVVRGRTGFSFAQELLGQDNAELSVSVTPPEVIELNDVSVEHYSNHLPTASFDRFYVRLTDVHGFALVGVKNQG